MFCLIPEKIEEFRKALKDGDLSLESLLDPKLSSEARTKIFEKYAGPENAADINRDFEEKLVLKNRILGIRNSFEKLGEFGKHDPDAKAKADAAVSEYKAAQTKRIFSPKENEAYLNQLADKQLGVHVSPEVSVRIFDLASKLDDLSHKFSAKDIVAAVDKVDTSRFTSEELSAVQNLKDSLLSKKLDVASANKLNKIFGDLPVPDAVKEHIASLIDSTVAGSTANIDSTGTSIDYLKTKAELDSYINAQVPRGTFKKILRNLASYGRDALLLNPSTPIKAIENQVVNSAINLGARRIGATTMKGAVNDGIVSTVQADYAKVYKATGDNPSSMESLDDTHRLGKGENYKTPAGGGEHAPGIKGGFKEIGTRAADAVKKPGIRTVGDFAETLTRRAAQATNKVAIDWLHNKAFTFFHQKAFLDTANLFASKLAEGDTAKATEIFKDAARIVPETQEGAMIRQLAQEQAALVTSTNDTVISNIALATKNALNRYTGFPLGDFVEPIVKISGNAISNAISNAGAGLPGGIMDVFDGRSKITSDDIQTRYEGMIQMAKGYQALTRIAGTLAVATLFAYSIPKDHYRTDAYGNTFVNIGGVWINGEYFMAISPALAGMMAVRTKSTSIANAPLQYVGGVGSALLRAPGVHDVADLVQALSQAGTSGGADYAARFFDSRGIPVFLSNLATGKPIKNLFFGASGVQTVGQYDAQLKTKKAAAAAKAKATKAAKKK